MGGSINFSIVVVDDNPRVLRSFQATLLSQGATPVLFASYDEAVEGIKTLEEKPAAFMLDYVLAGNHFGSELIEPIREKCGSESTIALVTGYNSEELEQFSSTVDVILTKPVVRAKIGDFLMSSVLHRQKISDAVQAGILKLTNQFGLSVQETRAVAGLASGSTRSSLARDLGISSNTVKSQIRQLLSKTHCVDTDHFLAMLLKSISDASRLIPVENSRARARQRESRPTSESSA